MLQFCEKELFISAPTLIPTPSVRNSFKLVAYRDLLDLGCTLQTWATVAVQPGSNDFRKVVDAKRLLHWIKTNKGAMLHGMLDSIATVSVIYI